MNYSTLVSTKVLNQHIDAANWAVIDCRFSLADSQAGEKAYRMGHIPNARYAHLDRDLSSVANNTTGRHPLPDFKLLQRKIGDWGISHSNQVVVYDDVNGAIAARLWWLLRTMGHDNVAVLDGGFQHWQKQGLPITTTLPTIKPKAFRAYLNQSSWLNAIQVENGLATKSINLLDARATERFQGKQEPIDPVAGHIPKAINRAFNLNLDANGLFLSRDNLRQQFKEILGLFSAEQIVHMCGSGVTACHNQLAMDHAGLYGSKLYAGSWSDWITNQNRAIVT